MGRRRPLTAIGPVRPGRMTIRTVLSREVEVQGWRLSYCEVGIGAPVLLLHGYAGSGRWWFPILPALSDAGFRAVAPDLPGFGRSKGSAPGLDEMARLLAHFVDEIGLGNFYLAGHSMGAAIGVRLAANLGRRVRRLVLIDSAGIPEGSTRRVIGQLARPWAWESLRFGPSLVLDVVRAGPRSLWRSARELRTYDLRPSLDRIQVPVLLIWGGRDRLTPPEHGEQIAARLHDSRMELLADARHMPMVTHPTRVTAAMARFLKKAARDPEAPGT